jgi:hypothetical protein
MAFTPSTAKVGGTGDEIDDRKSLLWALRMAMTLLDQTLPNPFNQRCTKLYAESEKPPTHADPFSGRRPPNLVGRNCCQYSGLYHTDVTIPSKYFNPNADGPTDPQANLDLTYLHAADPTNPAFFTTGRGLDLEGG